MQSHSGNVPRKLRYSSQTTRESHILGRRLPNKGIKYPIGPAIGPATGLVIGPIVGPTSQAVAVRARRTASVFSGVVESVQILPTPVIALPPGAQSARYLDNLG